MFDFDTTPRKMTFFFKIKEVEIIVLQQRNGHQRNEGAEKVWKQRTPRTR